MPTNRQNASLTATMVQSSLASRRPVTEFCQTERITFSGTLQGSFGFATLGDIAHVQPTWPVVRRIQYDWHGSSTRRGTPLNGQAFTLSLRPICRPPFFFKIAAGLLTASG